MNRKLRSRFSTRVALATVAGLIMTVGLTVTLSATGDRVDSQMNSGRNLSGFGSGLKQPGGSPLPAFSKSFSPDTIGPGSVTNLTLTIDNTGSHVGVTDLAFSDTFPMGVTIATPSSAFTDCTDAILSAPDGGSTITLSNARLGAFGSCSVSVNVVGQALDDSTTAHMNVSGDLTSSAGNSGAAAATLTVDIERPGFSKSFAPDSVPLGATSTLTLTIDNTLNASNLLSILFADPLPTGMVVASPANATSDCGSATVVPTLTAVPGTGTVSLSVNGTIGFPVLAAGASCTVTVDVTTDANGVFTNTTLEMTTGSFGSGESSGVATAALEVLRDSLVKVFLDDPVPPGGSVTLEFTITNFDRAFPMTDIAFDDLIDPMGALTGLAPGETLPKAACGGTLDFLGGVLSLTGGSLPAGGSCTFGVVLDVPAMAPAGTYANATDPLTGTIDGIEVTLDDATDELTVSTDPLFTKEFIDDPVGAGGAVTLRFTIVNTDPTLALSALEFTDDLNTAIPGLAANSLVMGQAADPLLDVCGLGSELTVVDPDDIMVVPPIVIPADPTQLIFTGGSLAAAGSPGDSCTFDLVIDVPAGTPTATYTNTTNNLTGLLGGVHPILVEPVSGDLEVVGAPTLVKEFIDDPVQPGETVTLQFTLMHDASASEDATAVNFTDDLNDALMDLTATGLPLADLCGPGNGTLTGSAMDTFLTFSGATLAPGQVCTFSVILDVPAAAAPGSYTNTTSPVSATEGGNPTIGNPASDDLVVAALTFTKEFIDDPVIPGGTVTLRFTIENTSLVDDATGIFFTDSLSSVLPGVPDLTAAAPLPANPCGGTLSGTTFLIFAGGSVLAGTSCTFDVTLDVPVGVDSNTYINATSSLTASIGGSTVSVDPAVDGLVVESRFLSLTKEFTDDPVLPGDTVNLRFTLTNLDDTQAATSVAFTDNLDAVVSGLAPTGLPFGACGGTVADVGNTIEFSGGSLAASGTCSFDVTLQVPGSVNPSSVATNTTSEITGEIGGLVVNGDPAIDDLTIRGVGFTKSFDGPTFPGGAATLTFTIVNADPATSLNTLMFRDNLDAVIPGMVATGLPAADVCGTGSQIAGTSVLTLSGGNLLPNTSCTFSVSLLVPSSATLGSHLNTTSDLREAGVPVAPPAQDLLIVGDSPVGTPRMETGTVTADGTHVAVPFVNTYADPVVVATVHVVNNTDPVVARVRNVTAAGFELRLQNPSGGALASDDVSYWVVERGVWVFDGIRLEADKYLSTQVSRKGAFNPEVRPYGLTYVSPVVLGQVMTENDPRWSSFFAQGGSLSSPPTPTDLRMGRQIGEDTDHSRANETVGYIVVEAVHTTLGGVEFEAAVGADTVLGVPNGAPFTYTFNSSFSAAPTNAVMSIAGIDGGDGAWAQGQGAPLATTNSLFLSVDEDQIGDAERSHTDEQVAYAAFSGNLLFPAPPACTVDADCDDGRFCNGAETCDAGTCLIGADPCPGNPCDEVGDVCLAGVSPKLETITTVAGGLAPATVFTANSYVSPVIACTTVYDNNTSPVVVRLDNVTGNSFDIALQNPGDGSPVFADTVHCLVVEEGNWIIDGHPVEAGKYTSTITDQENGYLGAAQTLAHNFTNPVVVGQVMSSNDSRWSVYWQQGASRQSPPTAAALRNGKMVAEDPVVVRNDEVVGYIVFEQAHGTLGGVEFEAALGPDTVRGTSNGPPFDYTFQSPFAMAPTVAVATQAGMDGTDGSWAYLFGSSFATTTTLSLAVDEDQLLNAERGHTTEQVAYVVFEGSVVFPAAPCTIDADCADGSFCNGVETCNAGTCVPGTPVDCADAVGCTVDSCNEGTDSCDNTPNDGLCDNGQFCDGAETCDAVLDCQVGTDPCSGGTCDEVSDVCPGVGPVAQMEWGLVSGVDDSVTTVNLSNNYLDPVVVTSIDYSNNSIPVVARVTGVTGNKFDVFLQNPSGGAVAAENVSYLVVEKGTWIMDGVKIEAQKYLSTKTAHDGDWTQFDPQAYGQGYMNPVVLGQVMSTNDASFSTFWTRGGSRGAAPTAAVLNTGKMVGEDPNTARADETIGFIVIERGHGYLGGVEFEAGLSADFVGSVANAPPYAQAFATAFPSPPTVAVAVQEAMDGFNGGWMYTLGTPTTTVINLAGDEDQLADAERSRSTEQAGYCVFQIPGVFP